MASPEGTLTLAVVVVAEATPAVLAHQAAMVLLALLVAVAVAAAMVQAEALVALVALDLSASGSMHNARNN
jgi:hypothetical protein